MSVEQDSDYLRDGLRDSDLPGVYQTANGESIASQRWYLRLTKGRLSFVILAAACGAWAAVVNTPEGLQKSLAAAAVACFFLALSAEILLLTRSPEDVWYHGRAVAESSKTLAWRYAMRADPFAASEDVDEVDRRMKERLQELLSESPIANELPPIVGDPITVAMRGLRESTLEDRKRAYLHGRVDEQKSWYAKKAEFNNRRASAWRFALIAFELAGALWALLVLTDVTKLALDGVLASMVAGAGAWLEVKQFDNLSQAYGLTATELTFALSDGESVADEAGWATYVNSAEQAISREHTMWLARRVKPVARRRRN
jgi:hypothetical protein